MNENREIKGCLEIKSCLKIKRWLKFYINRWTLLVNFPEWLYFRSTLTFQNLWLKSDYPSSRKTMLVWFNLQDKSEPWKLPNPYISSFGFLLMFSANSDFQKRGKKIHYNVDPAQKCSVTSSDYLMNVQISELLVFRIEVVFWRTFSVSSLLYIVESVTGERKKCFQPPTLLHNQFSNGETRASQVLSFLLVPPIILLPSRTIVNCCPIVKKQICVPTVDQKVLSNVQQRVNFSLWEPVTGSTSSQQRWNEQEVNFFIAPAGRLTSSSYLSSQSKYDK